jgi:hypothetical protein
MWVSKSSHFLKSPVTSFFGVDSLIPPLTVFSCDSIALALFESLDMNFVRGVLLFETRSPIDPKMAQIEGKVF